MSQKSECMGSKISLSLSLFLSLTSTCTWSSAMFWLVFVDIAPIWETKKESISLCVSIHTETLTVRPMWIAYFPRSPCWWSYWGKSQVTLHIPRCPPGRGLKYQGFVLLTNTSYLSHPKKKKPHTHKTY